MKTRKQIYKLGFVVLFSLAFINLNVAQDNKQTFEKTFKIEPNGELEFSCYDTDLKINTWDKNEVKLKGEIIIEGGSEDDRAKLFEVFKNPNISQSSNSLKIGTDLARSTLVIGPFKRMTLVDGKTIRVDKYEASYTLWIPKNLSLELKSKYNDIYIANLQGDAEFDLYEVDLTLISFKNADFEMKYSSADIGNGEHANFEIYESEFEIKSISEIDARTKYSEYKIENAGYINVDSYEDDFEIKKLSKGLNCNAKYSDFVIYSNTEKIEMDVYETDLEVLNVNEVEYSAKYSKFKAENVTNFKCNSLYEVKIYANTVGTFSCHESKYDNINIREITKSVDLPSTYELDMDVQSVASSLVKFHGDFKYGTVNFPLPTNLEFKLDFLATYGDVDFPKDRIKIRDLYIKEDSKQSFEGATSENAKCEIRIKSYDADIDLD